MLFRSFAIGVDRSKMRLYDIGTAALDIDTHEQESKDEFSEYSGKTYLKEKFSSFKY